VALERAAGCTVARLDAQISPSGIAPEPMPPGDVQ
jgi:hypothetical protein